MVVANPDLFKDIKSHSTKDFNINACFNCGTCTAICPLSTEENEFPRSMIRYGHVGLKDKLLSEKKLWICSACNDCSESCPRNATPSLYMNAVRKWAIGQYDVTGISRFLFKNKWNFKLATIIVAFLLATMFVVTANLSAVSNARPIALFDVISYEFIHNSSLLIFGLIGLIIVLSLLNQAIRIMHAENTSIKDGIMNAKQDQSAFTIFHLIFSPLIMVKEAIEVLVFEVFGQKKQYECLEEKSATNLQKLNSKWMYHVFTIFGFVGLLLATALDMFLKPDHNEMVPILYPIRLLGIISGIFFVIGISAFIIMRVFKVNKYYAQSDYEDYFLLIDLWVIGFTGLLLTTTLYLTIIPASLAYYLFIVHIVAFYELMIFAPFSKFAHVWFRTFAIWLNYGLEKRKAKLAV